MIDRSDLEKTSVDLRVGMGIGGWHMKHTVTHKPTGCCLSYETRGSYPKSQHAMYELVVTLLEMLVEEYQR